MTDVRRFDFLEKVVKDERRRLDDLASTVLARLGSHVHAAGTIDHGTLTGLADNDHPQYSLTSHGHDATYPRKDLLTAKGDLYAATAAGTVDNVAIGTRHYVLTADTAFTTGMKWAPPIQVVTSTGSITSPYTNQVILETTDLVLYRYTGSVWEAFLALGGTTAATRHEARYEKTTSQTINSSTDTKVSFPTAATTSDDVTPSGTGNTDFAINRGGVWRVSATLRLAGNGADDVTLFASTGTVIGTLTNRFVMQAVSIEGTTAPSLSISTDIRLTAGSSVFIGAYQNSGVGVGTDTIFGKTNHIALTWMRP